MTSEIPAWVVYAGTILTSTFIALGLALLLKFFSDKNKERTKRVSDTIASDPETAIAQVKELILDIQSSQGEECQKSISKLNDIFTQASILIPWEIAQIAAFKKQLQETTPESVVPVILEINKWVEQQETSQ